LIRFSAIVGPSPWWAGRHSTFSPNLSSHVTLLLSRAETRDLQFSVVQPEMRSAIYSAPAIGRSSVGNLRTRLFCGPAGRKIVRHCEYSGHRVGAHASDVLIGLTVSNTVEVTLQFCTEMRSGFGGLIGYLWGVGNL
jgi:hypothetical protein